MDRIELSETRYTAEIGASRRFGMLPTEGLTWVSLYNGPCANTVRHTLAKLAAERAGALVSEVADARVRAAIGKLTERKA
jgi:hypothetical protein